MVSLKTTTSDTFINLYARTLFSCRIQAVLTEILQNVSTLQQLNVLMLLKDAAWRL